MSSRVFAVVLLCLAGCELPKKRAAVPAPASVDAGPRAVTVRLGAPVTELEGDVWPRSQQRTLSIHELKGPLELTVVLPSGRRFTLAAQNAVGTIDDHHWPKRDDPPELKPPNVELISSYLGRYPTYLAALDVANQQLALVGVEAARIEETDRLLREREAPHPSYPLEACVYAGANLLKVGRGYSLSIDVGLRSTCAADAGR